MSASDTPSPRADAPSRPKWIRLALIVVGGGAALAGIRLTPAEVFGTNANRLIATLVCSLIVGLLFCAWLYLDSGLRRGLRRTVLATYLLLVAAGIAVFRVERPTFGGDM